MEAWQIVLTAVIVTGASLTVGTAAAEIPPLLEDVVYCHIGHDFQRLDGGGTIYGICVSIFTPEDPVYPCMIIDPDASGAATVLAALP